MGLGLRQKIQKLKAMRHSFRFQLKCKLSGFENNLIYLQRLDKVSLLYILKKHGAKIGQHVDIETGQSFHNCSDFSKLHIGDHSHIGKNCFIDLRDEIHISSNVTISMQCSFITHQDMGNSSLDKIYGKTQGAIHIKSDCYLGINSTILQGVHIGKGSIIAAGSLVSKNIDINTIAGGTPAKAIKKTPQSN